MTGCVRGCHGRARPLQLPLGGRVVWRCPRHATAALLARLRELVA